MATPPTFVFVPGVFHTPAHAQPLLDALQAKGYPTHAVALTTVGELASTAPPNADVQAVKKVLEKLVEEEEKEVVLLCHSYGGVVGSQAVAGLEKSRRNKGGIIKVVFLAAILPREGEGLLEAFAATPSWPGSWLLPAGPVTMTAYPEAAEVLFHDLDPDAQSYWAGQLAPMSAHVLSTPAVGVCWAVDIPKMYIFCTQDRSMPLQAQRVFVERVNMGDDSSWKTVEMDCGHSPFLSHIDQLVAILTEGDGGSC
ncbi:AB hydrolase-1 domain-containing protein [Mycena indigotica]|uniref:AB hydrolase-1 domain-containing protein n=1 Tax=Mycena indigotica TaxID=2126181 RepID=A0A8H6W6I3_9AGAR|nr:AB hydrolase-1 domain-containing protein [Mycena indigotica]KAF7301104.1 AB hydrolase-1 domain-containing protein [Mycena indigotica]